VGIRYMTQPQAALTGRSNCYDMESVNPVTAVVSGSTTGQEPSYLLKGRTDQERNYDSANIYRVWLRQFGEAPEGVTPARWHQADLRFVSEFSVAPNSVIENEVVSDLSNNPPTSNWTVRIPFKAQHLAVAPTARIMCWGFVSGHDRNRPPADYGAANRSGEGWMDQIPEWDDDSEASLGSGSISEEYRDHDPPIYPFRVMGDDPSPAISPRFYPQPGRSLYRSQGLTNLSEVTDVIAYSISHLTYTSRFRNCLVKIEAEGRDGRSFRPLIEIPTARRSALLSIPDSTSEPYYTDRHFYGSRSLGSCQRSSDCANNCTSTGGELPCTECRLSSHTCWARGFPAEVYYTVAPPQPVYSVQQ